MESTILVLYRAYKNQNCRFKGKGLDAIMKAVPE